MDKLHPPIDIDSSKYRRVDHGRMDETGEMLDLAMFCTSSSRG